VKTAPDDSASFVDVARNRNSLEPTPAELPSAACLHSNVCQSGAAAAFSAQRGHPVFPIRVPARSLSMSVGELAAGTATSNHRHAYEALTYILEGRGHTLIEGQRFDWQVGDAIYVPPWCWHQHHASDDSAARYLTATNQPLLVALGNTAVRQESNTEAPGAPAKP
jgi:quercetin dioxygenase-like cupin family protein